jgi:hypothetical protein
MAAPGGSRRITMQFQTKPKSREKTRPVSCSKCAARRRANRCGSFAYSEDEDPLSWVSRPAVRR